MKVASNLDLSSAEMTQSVDELTGGGVKGTGAATATGFNMGAVDGAGAGAAVGWGSGGGCGTFWNTGRPMAYASGEY
jgi:hypothetical protein